jgi:transaldolase
MVIYLDGADVRQMGLLGLFNIDGFTTNPSLMRKSGVTDYPSFARSVLECACDKPVSFEVLASDMEGMAADAMEIASWGENVFVKIPVVTPSGAFTGPILSRLSLAGVKLNVTAVMTEDQVHMAMASLQTTGHIISIFAGRIADSGVDPEPIITQAKDLAAGRALILWASVREAFNVIQAERSGADIITLTPEMLQKISLFGRDLTACSVETVKQFTKDAEGITL